MAYTLTQIQPGSRAAANPQTAAFGVNVSSGSLLVWAFTLYSDTVTISSITDTLGNTWSVVSSSPANGMNERAYIAAAYCPTGGANTGSIALSGAIGFTSTLYEFAGGPASLLTDVANSGSGTGTVPSFTLTGVAANAVIVGQLVSNAAPTKGAAFTLGSDVANNFYENTQYLLDQGATGNRTVDWSPSATWTAAAASFKLTAGGPSITGGTANPVHLSTGNTITGTGFGASQGAGTLVIGGQAQTVTAWADTSITYTANRGVNLNDVAVNAVVTDNGGTPSANYALTGFDPPAGYYFVTLTSVNATAANRITAIADLAIGNQLEWDNADVTINNDATWDAADTVTSFNVRAGVTTDGWGSLGLQTINLGGASTGRAMGLGLKLGRVVYA